VVGQQGQRRKENDILKETRKGSRPATSSRNVKWGHEQAVSDEMNTIVIHWSIYKEIVDVLSLDLNLTKNHP
jgi:hypothetical protein